MRIAARTGWPEEFIRWELPMWRANAYYHAAAIMDGERFRWKDQPSRLGRWFDTVKAWARGLVKGGGNHGKE